MNIRMSTKGKRPLRSLTPSDKIHAIQRIHDGESKASVARDIGVPESTLRGWCKNEDKLRFMSRQSTADKLSGDPLSERMDGGSSGIIGGPCEKRPKIDQASLPLNFSSKLKFEDMTYKRNSINGLDYSTSKALSDLSFNTLTPDYASFNGGVKSKIFGADISRQADPSMAAISPLSSLSHISGLAGISQSPLAISFNELTSNLNLLAQLNPGLAAMSSLNGLAATANTLRNVKHKVQPQISSPRSDTSGERPGLSVKNWAKQKSIPISNLDNDFGLNLSQNTIKGKIKCPSPSLAPSIGTVQHSSALSDDPLLYWLKSQQTMLGLNNMYPPPSMDATNSPIRSSTPQHQPDLTPNIISTPMTSSSTPSLDEKNAAWISWCKAFGASLNSLAPVAAAAAIHTTPLPQQFVSTSAETADNLSEDQKSQYENILYSHLTKDASNSSARSSTPVGNIRIKNEANGNGNENGTYQAVKPEDLSAKVTTISSTPSSPIMPITPSADVTPTKGLKSPMQSPMHSIEGDINSQVLNSNTGSITDCKDILDNLVFKIKCTENLPLAQDTESCPESDNSCHNLTVQNNNDICANNNNNNSNKTDEEERMKLDEYNNAEDLDAIRHGEKFLKWLENCSNPRVTAVHLMQLRFLISAVKSTSDTKTHATKTHTNTDETLTKLDEIHSRQEETTKCKIRRRK